MGEGVKCTTTQKPAPSQTDKYLIVKSKINWVQFAVGAILGALIGFSLWMSLPMSLTYSRVAGVACVSAMALLVGLFVARNPFRKSDKNVS
jgi:hypothetical protein